MNKRSIILLGGLILFLIALIALKIISISIDNLYIEISNAALEIITISLAVTFTISFSFNINVNTNKEIHNLKTQIKNLNVNITNNITSHVVNPNQSIKASPCLSIDIVGYRIEESFMQENNDKDAIVFTDPEDLSYNILKYYILAEPNQIEMSNNEIDVIQDFRKTTFKELKLQSGWGTVDKPYHLFVFALKNISDIPMLNFRVYMNNNTSAKLISKISSSKTLMPNEKNLFMILFNYATSNYEFKASYYDQANTQYEQTLNFEVSNQNVYVYQDKFIPPVIKI